jgi:hypothetical protein
VLRKTLPTNSACFSVTPTTFGEEVRGGEEEGGKEGKIREGEREARRSEPVCQSVREEERGGVSQ